MYRMTLEACQGKNRRIAAIDSRSRAPSTSQYQIQVVPVRSGVSSSLVVTFACRKKGLRSRLFVEAAPSLRFVSPTGERKAIARFVSSVRAASAAKCSPAFRAFKASDSTPSLPDAPPCGRSRPDGRRRLGHGSILSCELSTPRFILVFGRLLRTRLRTAAKCARCGTGRATSTEGTYL